MLPERIWANDMNHWHPFEGEQGTEEFIRQDIHDQAVKELVDGLQLAMYIAQRPKPEITLAWDNLLNLIEKYGGEK